jgi:pimeloyl-ACP methyl ester carboxylesterase
MNSDKIILLPGLDGTGLLFKPLLDCIQNTQDVKVISYPTNICQDYNQLMDLVLSQLPNEDFILVAESFSGYIAYLIGLKKPKYLKRIVFVATFLISPRPFLLGFSKMLPMSLLLNVNIPNFFIKRFLFGQFVNKETIKLFKKSINEVDSKVMANRLSLIADLKAPSKSSSIEATYIQAIDDKLIDKNSVEIFKKLFLNLTIHKIRGTHFLLQSNPSKCIQIIFNKSA